MKKYGLEGVSNYWCEGLPLFELRLSSQDGLKRLLHAEEKVQSELASRVAAMLTEQQKLPEPVAVYAHTEVHMLTPRPESKDAHIIQVSSENLATCTTIWRESEVFNFGALFQALTVKDHKGTLHQGNCFQLLAVVYIYPCSTKKILTMMVVITICIQLQRMSLSLYLFFTLPLTV